jgi:26S proteasome regulatory subunit N5
MQSADLSSNTRILKCVVSLCFKAKDYKSLCEYITTLMKKRGLLKQACQDMINLTITHLDGLEIPTKIEIIETIRTICDGKVALLYRDLC